MSLTTIEFFLGPLPQVIAISSAALIGVVLAINRRRIHPAASLLVTLGLLAVALSAVGSYAVRVYTYRTFDKWQDASVYGRHIAEVYAVLHSVDVAGVILIVAAVFANRLPVRKVASS